MMATVKPVLPPVIANRQPTNPPLGLECEMPFSLHAQDDRLTEDKIIWSLRETGYLQLRDVQVCVDEGSIVLRGNVSSYYLKQLSQSIAMANAKSHKLRNELDVVTPAHSRVAGPVRQHHDSGAAS